MQVRGELHEIRVPANVFLQNPECPKCRLCNTVYIYSVIYECMYIYIYFGNIWIRKLMLSNTVNCGANQTSRRS